MDWNYEALFNENEGMMDLLDAGINEEQKPFVVDDSDEASVIDDEDIPQNVGLDPEIDEDPEDLVDVNEDERIAPSYQWDEYDFDGEMPSVWPKIEVVNLDRRLPVKFKRHEYEPNSNAIISNISQQYPQPHKSEIVLEPFPEMELDGLIPYLLHHGQDSKEIYYHVRNLAKNLYKEKLNQDLTLHDLRELTPDTPLTLLAKIFELLIYLKEINFDASPPISDNEHSTGYPRSMLERLPTNICSICTKNCSKSRYFSKFDNHIICLECFDLGRYPYTSNSESFELQVRERSPQQEYQWNEWSEEEKLNLLRKIEKGEDWREIAQQLGRSVPECQFAFAMLPVDDYTPQTMSEKLQYLVGTTGNPIAKLIDLVTKSVHPGLGAEIARTSLGLLVKGSNLSQEMIWNVALLSFEQSLAKANEISNAEERAIRNLAQQVLNLELQIIEKRLKLVETYLSSPYKEQSEEATIMRLIANCR